MSQFQPQLLPPPRTFYQRELGKISSASRGWAKANCPFHQSKSKTSLSVNLQSGGFFCHGCGAKGRDVLAFLRLRDNLTFKEAAQRLGAWDDAPSPETVRKLEIQARERARQRLLEDERQAEQRRERMSLRDQIHTAVRIQREASERLSEIRQGVAPATAGEEEALWAVMQLARDDLRDCEREYMAQAGLEYDE